MSPARRRPARRKAAKPTRRKTTKPGRRPAAAPHPTRAVDGAAEVARVGTALTGEPDFRRGLARLLTGARRITGAEAGTVYLRHGDVLDFAVVQNDVLARRLGEAEVHKRLAARPLSLRETSIASYVVLTRATVNLRDAYQVPLDRPYTLYREVDRTADYLTRSMLATPLRDARGRVFGVLQLINALDGRGGVTAFAEKDQALVQALAAHAARLPVPEPAPATG